MSGRGVRLIRGAAGTAAGLIVLLGLVIVFTAGAMRLAGVDPGSAPTPGYLALNLAGSLFAAVFAGIVSGRIGQSVVPAAIVAAVLVLVSVGTGASGDQPTWYPVAVGLLGAVGLIGGAVIVPPAGDATGAGSEPAPTPQPAGAGEAGTEAGPAPPRG